MSIEDCCVVAWKQTRMRARIELLRALEVHRTKKVAKRGFNWLPVGTIGRMMLAVKEENGEYIFDIRELKRNEANVKEYAFGVR